MPLPDFFAGPLYAGDSETESQARQMLEEARVKAKL